MPVKSLNFTTNYSEQEQDVKMERTDLRDSCCVYCIDKNVYKFWFYKHSLSVFYCAIRDFLIIMSHLD